MTIKFKEDMIVHICNEISKFTDVAVVGLSGGIDSTVIATLCKLALKKENVYGISMPYNDQDVTTFNARSESLAKKLGINHSTVSIRKIADSIVDCTAQAAAGFGSLTETELHPISQLNRGNARSRARMTVLYSACSHLNETLVGKRVRVIGTGNLSEDYIGYDTKGGDALADIFPIGELFKSEVYELADYFISMGLIDESHVDRVPSAGLWSGQTDESELGYTYNAMEPVIKNLLGGVVGNDDPTLLKFVVDRHNANKHKHLAPPVIEVRSYCE